MEGENEHAGEGAQDQAAEAAAATEGGESTGGAPAATDQPEGGETADA